MTENEALKLVFRNMNAHIIREVNPDFVIDELFGKDVITEDDHDKLYDVSDTKDRCRKLFVLLRRSSHPETFIQLRLALLDEYPQVVEKIDEQLTSSISPQQSTEG